MEIHSRSVRRTAGDRRHSSSRERLLREVESRDGATIVELAGATELHVNTVRGHLMRLREDGHVEQRSPREQPNPGVNQGKGRPAQRWYSVEARTRNPHEGLARVLAEALAQPLRGATASEDVRRLGVEWGRALARRSGKRNRAPESMEPAALEIMREQGFAPEVVAGAEELEILLYRCPLLAAANLQPEIVCAAHEGMIEGAVREHDENVRARLLPIVNRDLRAHPEACVLRLRGAA